MRQEPAYLTTAMLTGAVVLARYTLLSAIFVVCLVVVVSCEETRARESKKTPAADVMLDLITPPGPEGTSREG